MPQENPLESPKRSVVRGKILMCWIRPLSIYGTLGIEAGPDNKEGLPERFRAGNRSSLVASCSTRETPRPLSEMQGGGNTRKHDGRDNISDL